MEYTKGDRVSSVGGFFTEGTVENVEMENDMEILTIRWLKDTRKGDIDFVQRRASSIVRRL